MSSAQTEKRQIICLTGQMAAGKNAVSSILEAKGFACVDFDVLVHNAIDESTSQILKAFAKEAQENNISLQNENGTLNRRALGSIIFKDSNLIAKQESIVYPKVTKLAQNFITSNPEKPIVFNATVLFKIPQLMESCSVIFYVTAPFFRRLLRAKKRDGLQIKNILSRFKSQKTLFAEYKKTGIPIVKINNGATLKNLEKTVEATIKSLKLN